MSKWDYGCVWGADGTPEHAGVDRIFFENLYTALLNDLLTIAPVHPIIFDWFTLDISDEMDQAVWNQNIHLI